MQKRIFPKYKHMQRVGKQIRHTHRTAAAFEDGIAISTDIIDTLSDVLEITRLNGRSPGEMITLLGDAVEFARTRAQNAVEVLKQARKGPHAYDPDRPAGRRFTIRWR